MVWSPTPTLPTRTPRPGWFPETPGPVARQPSPAWFPVYTADLDAELAALTAQFVGEVRQHGDLAMMLQHALFAGEGEHRYEGELAGLLRAPAFLGTNVTMGQLDAQLPAPIAGLAAQQAMAGTMAAALSAPELTAAGQQIYTGALSAALHQAAAALVGTQGIPGTIDADLGHAIMAATGQQTQTGAIAAVLRRALFVGAGGQVFTGALASQLRKAIAAATGTVKKLVVFDNASDGGHGGTSTRSWTHNLQGNCIVAMLTHTNGSNPTATYGGVSLTRVYGYASDGGVFPYTSRITIFARVGGLPTGNNTVSISNAATASAAGAASFHNAGSIGSSSADTGSGNVNKSASNGEGSAAVVGYVGGASNFGAMSPNEVMRDGFTAFDTWSTVMGWGVDNGGGITFTSSHSGAKTGALIPILPPA